MKKCRLFLFFVLIAVFTSTLVVATDFYDLPRDNSEKSQAVYKLADAGIVGGYENGTFRPNNQLTRAELCKIVNLIFNFTTPATTNFDDIKDTDWFYGHVLIAKQAGYINGFENNTFRGNDKLTREQTCAIISRITKLELKSSDIIINDNVSDWAKNDVLKVISNGIMPLESDGTFRAKENITRAELCMALARYVKIDNAEAEQKKFTAEELNTLAKNYVGEIVCSDKSGNDISIGTGFVYTSDGKVLTNYHVIDGAYSARITINGVEYNVTSILGYDETIDLAVLKINGTNLPHAILCENDSVTGNTVYAIGSSRGLTNTFSKGIITYFDRLIDGVNYVQHDASITNGNSGGPLINEYGEVIGVNTWGISDSQNLNFAVSISELDNISLNKTLTFAQFYNSKLTIYDNLNEFVKKNYNRYGDTYIIYEISKSEAESFGIIYYHEDNNLAIYYDLTLNNGDNRFVKIYLDNDDSVFYVAYYSDVEGNENKTSGYIAKNTYAASSVLNYSKSEGGVWDQESLMGTYQIGATHLLGFFSEFLKTYFPSLSLKDFGYSNFVPVKWTPYEASKDYSTNLIEWVKNNYNGYGDTYITYEINKSKAETFGVVYYHEDNDLAIYYDITFNSGDHRFVSIILDNEDSSGYFATYSNKEGNKNSTGGYIVKNTYTASSVLNYSKSEGGIWRQESLLDTYQEGCNILLGFFSDFLKSYFPSLSLKDFGYNKFVPVKWSPYQVVQDDFTKLKNYIIDNGEYNAETKNYLLFLNSFEHVEETEIYHYIAYDTTTYTIDVISILYDKLLDIDYTLCISMSDFDGVYDYYYIGQHTSDYKHFSKCNMNGSINATTFDYFSTLLPCEYHSYGSSGIVDCRSRISLLTFSICTFWDSYFRDLGITAKDIGFSNY